MSRLDIIHIDCEDMLVFIVGVTLSIIITIIFNGVCHVGKKGFVIVGARLRYWPSKYQATITCVQVCTRLMQPPPRYEGTTLSDQINERFSAVDRLSTRMSVRSETVKIMRMMVALNTQGYR